MSDKEENAEPWGEDEDEVPSSQIMPESEPQSSCETLMSQQSDNEDPDEKPEDKVDEDIIPAKTSTLSSSLEANTSAGMIEGNTSGAAIGCSYSEKNPSSDNLEKSAPLENPFAPNEGCGGESEGDIFQEKSDQDDSGLTKQPARKRKNRSCDSTPSPKRLRKSIQAVDSPEQKDSPKLVEVTQVQDVSVMEILSTPEKTIVIDDSRESQEFSLRIEENSQNSPPNTLCAIDKSDNPQKELQVKTTSPATSVHTAISSQKSSCSWTSHTNDILSWGSHKFGEDEKNVKGENGEHVRSQGDSEKDSSSDSLTSKNVDTGAMREVTEMKTGLVMLDAVVTWLIDSNNKVVSAKIKQVSLVEELPVEKPGRMSTVSTTSAKSSSSAGSVGLPGPFTLPGKTMLSRLSKASTVSSTTSSSAASNQAWDGPFLKPQVPGSKLNVTFSCDKCGHLYPPVDGQASFSPVLNGSPPEAVVDQEVKALIPKRGRKPKGINSGSTVSSGPLDEETSSSASHAPPQASSTPTKGSRGRPRRQAKVTEQNGTASKSAKKEASGVPAKTPRTVGRVSKNGSSESKKSNEGRGEPVLARWGGDGRYYPGWVAEPLTSAQTLVRFCDGQSKTTALNKIVKASVITPGTLVLAATRSGDYEEALVVQVDSKGAEPVYVVERDKTQREVDFASIALQQSTVTELTVSEAQKLAANTNFNDLSLENIIAHPRKRSARTPVEGSSSGRRKKRQTTPQPCTSHGQTYNGPDETYGDTDSSTHSTCSLDLRGKEIRPLDVECFPPESLETKLVYKRGNMAFKKKEGNKAVLAELGPLPEPGSKLFTDCVFLITYTDTVELLPSNMYSSADETGGPRSMSLWRDRLRSQICNGGGKVYNSLSEVTKDEQPNTYLITDKPCSTPLYLQCLVNNIPIYPHSLVIQCCAQNRPWKEVISGRGVKRLSAGYSLARRCMVNPRSSIPLRGRNLLLALSSDPSIASFWQSLITKVGGSVDLYPHGSLAGAQYNAVVTDAECDPQLVAEACAQRVPLVSMTWLQQVIITGEWRSPTEHRLYKYNVSSDAEGESPEY